MKKILGISVKKCAVIALRRNQSTNQIAYTIQHAVTVRMRKL